MMLPLKVLLILILTFQIAENSRGLSLKSLDSFFHETEHLRDKRNVKINGIEIPVNAEWLTDEQISELGEKIDEPSAMASIRKFYDELEPEAKKQAGQKITRQCYLWLPDVASEQEREELDKLHHLNHTECKLRIAQFMDRLPESRQKEMRGYWDFCEHVWYQQHDHDHGEHHGEKHAEEGETHVHHEHQEEGNIEQNQHRRDRRHHHYEADELEKAISLHLSWLTESQKEHLRTMQREDKGKVELVQEVMRYFEGLSGDEQKRAASQLQEGCRVIIREILGEHQAEELKQMRESGATIEGLSNRLEELLSTINDEEKVKRIQLYKPYCRKLFGISSTAHASRRRRNREIEESFPTLVRHRRDHQNEDKSNPHTFEGYFQTYLSWLSDAQKEELKALKQSGKSRVELQQKYVEFYEQISDGDMKERASAQIKNGCRELATRMIGADKVAELKQMKESGIPFEETNKKAEEFINQIGDEKNRAIAKEYAQFCKRFFNEQSNRATRHVNGHEEHHGAHTLEDYFKTHLSWLNAEQKDELRSLKASGVQRSELHRKVEEFYGQLPSEEEKEKAKGQLQQGCRELLDYVFGKEKADEFKKMRESGTPMQELTAKVDEMIEELTNPQKKATAKEYRPQCSKLFAPPTSPSRVRRSYFGSRGNQYRQQQIRNLEDEQMNNSEEEQVITPRERQRISTGLRDRYQNYQDDQQQIEENDDPIRRADRNSFDNTSDDDDDGVAATAEAARQAEERYGENFDLEGDDYRPHNRWLTPEQKRKVKSWQEEGQLDSEVHNRIHEMFDVSDGAVKLLAKGILVKGCEAIMERIFGVEKAHEIMEMRSRGAAGTEIDERIAMAVQNIEDDGERREAGRYALTCRRIMGFVMRKRRDATTTDNTDPDAFSRRFSFDELQNTHLSWLSSGQMMELREMKNTGKSPLEIQKKLAEFFRATEGNKRTEALQHLFDGCRELLSAVIGKENTEDLKRLRDSGVIEEQLEEKANAYLHAVGSEKKKELAKKFGPFCRNVLLRQEIPSSTAFASGVVARSLRSTCMVSDEGDCDDAVAEVSRNRRNASPTDTGDDECDKD